MTQSEYEIISEMLNEAYQLLGWAASVLPESAAINIDIEKWMDKFAQDVGSTNGCINKLLEQKGK